MDSKALAAWGLTNEGSQHQAMDVMGVALAAEIDSPVSVLCCELVDHPLR